MSRINIYSTPDPDGWEEPRLEGWFDPTKSRCFEAGQRWDGHNHVSVITNSQWIREYLYRTPGGRWVLNRDSSRYNDGPYTHEFVSDEQAKDWLLRSEDNDDAVAEFFGELPEEQGPGRPAIGPAFSVRFPADLLDRIDADAASRNISRAQWLREAAEARMAAAR